MLFVWLSPQTRRKVVPVLMLKSALGVAIVIVFSALVGIVANEIIVGVFRPAAVFVRLVSEQLDAVELQKRILTFAPELDTWYERTYHGMLFARSIIPPILGLSAIGLRQIWKRDLGTCLGIDDARKVSAVRCFVTVLLVIACIAHGGPVVASEGGVP